MLLVGWKGRAFLKKQPPSHLNEGILTPILGTRLDIVPRYLWWDRGSGGKGHEVQFM